MQRPKESTMRASREIPRTEAKQSSVGLSKTEDLFRDHPRFGKLRISVLFNDWFGKLRILVLSTTGGFECLTLQNPTLNRSFVLLDLTILREICSQTWMFLCDDWHQGESQKGVHFWERLPPLVVNFSKP